MTADIGQQTADISGACRAKLGSGTNEDGEPEEREG